MQQPHPFLSFAAAATLVHSVLWLAFGLLVFVVGLLGLSIFAGMSAPPSMAAGGMFGLVGLGMGALFALYFIFYGLIGAAGFFAFKGSRGWTWALLVLSLITITDLGPVQTPIRILACIAACHFLFFADRPTSGSAPA